jgi:long-chain acyl-CoA synthetase
MNHAAPLYDLKPWVQQYGRDVDANPPVPRFQHLAELVRDAAARFAAQTAFTTCMPNGMHGSLSYAQVDRHSDAFAVYLRNVLGLA